MFCSIATHGKTLLVLLPVRFSLLVKLEPILAFLPVVSIGVKLARLLLPFNRLVKIARLGVSGFVQLAGMSSQLNSLPAVPMFGIGASRHEPCQ